MWPTFPGFELQCRLGQGACGEVFAATNSDGVGCAVKGLDPEAINAYYINYCYGPQGPLAAPDAQAAWPLTLARVLTYQPATDQHPAFYALPLWADWEPGTATWQPRLAIAAAARVDRATVWQWIEDVAEALAFLHRHQIVHANVKPSQIFLEACRETSTSPLPRSRAVLTDWGQGWLGGATAVALTDHAFFAPPEQLRAPSDIDAGAGQRWDVYAFGATAYTLLTSRFVRGAHYAHLWLDPSSPENFTDPSTFADLIAQEAQIEWPFPPADAREAARRHILERCLAIVPQERWADAEEMLTAWREASHPASARPAITAKPMVPVPEAPLPPAEAPRTGPRRLLAASWLGLAGVAGVCGWGWYQSQRALAAQQAEHATADRTQHAQLAAQSAQLATTETALATAHEALRRLSQQHHQLQADFVHVFDAYLEAVTHLPAARERTRLLELGRTHFARFLADSHNESELEPVRLRARVHLAKITAALAPPAEALPAFVDARQALEAYLSHAALSPAESLPLQLLTADCALAEAQLRYASDQETPADTASLERSLRFLEQATEASQRSPELLRRLVEARLCLAQSALVRLAPPDETSVTRLQEALDELRLLLAEPDLALETDRVLLGQGLLLRGQLERRRGLIEPALATQVEAAQVLLDCKETPEVMEALARCYRETGDMLAQNGEKTEALRAYSEAIKLLTELTEAHPDRPEWRSLLGAHYAALAQLLHEQGNTTQALTYLQGTVRLGQALLVSTTSLPPHDTAFLARQQACLATWLNTSGQKNEAQQQAQTASRLLEKLELPPASQSMASFTARLNTARAYEILGQFYEAQKNAATAQQYFTHAATHYEAAAAAAPPDSAFTQELTAAQARLANRHR